MPAPTRRVQLPRLPLVRGLRPAPRGAQLSWPLSVRDHCRQIPMRRVQLPQLRFTRRQPPAMQVQAVRTPFSRPPPMMTPARAPSGRRTGGGSSLGKQRRLSGPVGCRISFFGSDRRECSPPRRPVAQRLGLPLRMTVRPPVHMGRIPARQSQRLRHGVAWTLSESHLCAR